MSLTALFLGYGRMGASLGEAWIEADLVQRIDAVDPHRAQDVKARVYRSAAELPDTIYDLVIVAVKPAMAREALAAVSIARLRNASIISVMAGVSIATLEQALPIACPVVRSMPNTPVMVHQGCVGLFGGISVTSPLRDKISQLYNAVGKSYWVETEEQLHAITALSGSGPAYYHLFSEALADAGERLGLPSELAKQLAAQTALGAATLQCGDGANFSSLRQEVTSPNGTTHAAIEVFEKDSALRCLVTEAVVKAHQRSIELSQG
ncbi:pyrroline-5-carboxylate reductase [Paracandidimonas soli]|uniref:Pyrroline-5-carboxylate reductase n=1 Tax=Paracandidimonas soli TaxID=1917182 RepID=A0A4R3VGH0_9BURK|nr:pyrroline-5-carboxylate reductase [Paracandidimonas soli]TCV03123.1 pyrroline-5-carboxylate reductase [Paracandidimonas soli]